MSEEKLLSARTEALFRRLVRRDAEPALKKLVGQYRPEDVAAVMGHMTWAEQRRLYDMLDDLDFKAEILALLPEDAVVEITREMTEEVFADLLDRMDPDDAVDVVGLLPEDVRERILAEMEEEEAVEELLGYDPETAGGLMSTSYFAMPDTASCGAAIRELQRSGDDLSHVQYLYVLDRDKRLVGVTSLRALVTRPSATPLVQIMTRNPIAVAPEVDQGEVAKYVARYDLMAIPVLDAESHLLGIVTVDDVVDVIREEAAADLLAIAGISDVPDAGPTSVVEAVRTRAGWLLATLAGGLLGSEVIKGFGDTLAQTAALAAFIPVIMGMGGNVGLQSATLTIRGLATGHVQIGGAVPFITSEVKAGVTIGVLYGLLMTLFGFVRYGSEEPLLGLAVGLSILTAMAGASLLGATIPVVLSRVGQDPAVATGPLVTTCIDLASIIVYFSVSGALLGLA
jgi:magnesium transporter